MYWMSLGGSHLGCLFVRPERQGQGIGAALLDHVKQKYSELDLTVYRQNERATRFYEREGFREVARTDGDNEEGLPDILFRWAPEGP